MSLELAGKIVRIKNSEREFRFVRFLSGAGEESSATAIVMSSDGSIHEFGACQIIFNINEIFPANKERK